MAKFKLMKRYKLRNAAEGPTEGAEDDLWYAIPALGNRLDTREVCKAATRYSTVAPAEAEMVLNLLRDGVVHELQLGNSVQLGEFGWMRLSFSSEGVKDVTEFNAGSMMRNVKLVFTPSKELMRDIRDGLRFESAGVVSGGITFSDTKSYLHYRRTGELPGAEAEE